MVVDAVCRSCGGGGGGGGGGGRGLEAGGGWYAFFFFELIDVTVLTTPMESMCKSLDFILGFELAFFDFECLLNIPSRSFMVELN